MIKTALKYIGLVIFVYVFLCLVTPYITSLKNRSVKNQINYLSGIIEKGYDNTLQNRFPEGKLFSNSLLALSTIEYCNKNQIFNSRYSSIVDNCILRIQSKNAVSTFSDDLDLEYGMFYNGWSNFVYRNYIDSKLFDFSEIQKEVTNKSYDIEQKLLKIQHDSIRLLETYAGANWPADNMIAISSLNNELLKTNWIETILDNAEHKTGLINHASSDLSEIRGSSSAMITYCLGKSNYANTQKYNETYRSIFVDEYFGIELVKENENGSHASDVDSGPVVFGYGASGTIMNIKTQASLANKNAKVTWAVMNTLALPINVFNKKYYLLKKEPMLDLFMLWASTEL